MIITLEVTYVKNGGQSDLHFDHFDVGCNIVKWGVIFGVFKGAKLKSGLKNNEHHTGGHLCKKMEVTSILTKCQNGNHIDLHFTNLGDLGLHPCYI